MIEFNHKQVFSLEGRRVYVAGHNGMVGSALLRRLSKEKCEVLSVDIKPLSIRYPSLELRGERNFTFSLLSKLTLYSLKVRSSIAAPFKEIDPIILWFSNKTLSLSFKASSLDILTSVSFSSNIGVSVFCSILFPSLRLGLAL